MKNSIETFVKLKDNIKQLGGDEKVKKQHEQGKLTARERINVLLDNQSFEEYFAFVKHRSVNFGLDKQEINGDGVVTGYGTIFGRPVFVFSQDFTSAGGSLGEMHAKKIVSLQQKALQLGVPIIGICDSGGARIQEGIDSLAGFGDIFQNNIISSGVIPQISVIMGPCAGGAVYSPALTDFIFMVANSAYMFVTGPDVVKAVINESVTKEELGGSDVHSGNGVIDFVFDNDIETLLQVRKCFSFLPLSNKSPIPKFKTEKFQIQSDVFLDTFMPEESNKSYNMYDIITRIIDDNEFFEVKKDYAKNIIVGLARIAGETVGIVANQPCELGGCLDIKSSCKGARFIRFCDAFNIPIISFVDVPGFLPGTEQEHNGIIKHGAKLLYAYGEATVPKITIITRKSYGGAYIVMGSKHLGGDVNYAWPMAEISVMGSKGAGEILFRKSSKTQEDYDLKIKEYEDKFGNPFFAASRGYLDDIIKPRDTKEMIYRSLQLLKNKNITQCWKKHDNLPL